MPDVLGDRLDLGAGQYAALLTLNRPDALNALSWDMLSELEWRLLEIAADDDARIVLITGSGRAFCAGGDLKAYIELQQDADAYGALVDLAHRVFALMRHLRQPVVCLVNGAAAAGGLELMLSSDFSYAARSARIGDAHLRFGQMAAAARSRCSRD